MVFTIVAAIVVLELGSLIVTFGWYWKHDIVSYRLLDQFVVTRYLVSPFVFENPIKARTKARYLGPITNVCVAAQWRRPDTLLGWMMAPSVGILKQPYRVDGVTGWRFTNSQGFPSSGEFDFYYARPKPPKTFRVIVTGASTVEGDGAESPELNLVAQLREQMERELAGRLAPSYDRIEVINAGVGGYQSSQEYLYLISDLVTYEPDLVVSYGGAVDIARAWITYDQEGRSMDRFRTYRHDIDSHYLEQSFTILSPLAMFGSNIKRAADCVVDELAMTYFFNRVYERVENIVRRVFGTERKALEARTKTPDYSIPVQSAIASYRNSVRLMMKAAEIYGFRIAFFLQPAMATDEKPLTKIEKEVFDNLSASELKLRSHYWSAARELVVELKASTNKNDGLVCVADLSHPFEGVQERTWDDSRHLLGVGNRIVAKQLLDHLRVCHQLPVR